MKANGSCSDDDNRHDDGRLVWKKRTFDCDVVQNDRLHCDFWKSAVFVHSWIFVVDLDVHRCWGRVVDEVLDVVLDADVALGYSYSLERCCRNNNRLRCDVWQEPCGPPLFDLFCPCYCFYVVEVEVVVAGYASYVPLVAGGHRTDHHFHSSDPRRTRVGADADEEVVRDLDQVQEDPLDLVHEAVHEEEEDHGEVPWVLLDQEGVHEEDHA